MGGNGKKNEKFAAIWAKMYNEMEKFVVIAGELHGGIVAATAFLIGSCLFFMPALK